MIPDFFRHYKTEIALIDTPHALLIEDMEEINRLFYNKDFDQLHNLLTLLETKLIAHLIDEEEFMENIKYPHIEFHKQAHVDILKKMADVINQLDTIATRNYGSNRLADQLRVILVDHIDHYDMQITNYIKITPELCKIYFPA